MPKFIRRFYHIFQSHFIFCFPSAPIYLIWNWIHEHPLRKALNSYLHYVYKSMCCMWTIYIFPQFNLVDVTTSLSLLKQISSACKNDTCLNSCVVCLCFRWYALWEKQSTQYIENSAGASQRKKTHTLHFISCAIEAFVRT